MLNKKKEAHTIIKEYISKHTVAVFSTITKNGNPEAAVMSFSETEHLEIIFQTPKNTRKYQNLLYNPHIALVIGWDTEEFITVQYEGIAQEVKEEVVDVYRQIHIAKNPASAKYAFLQENKYFKVTPQWIKYTDLKTSPPTIYLLDSLPI